MTKCGIVIIGRNEGERLRRCLESAVKEACDVVYVDSGSTDDSVPYARQAGAIVLELDTHRPFTAGRARNAGSRELIRINPDVEFIQFVDGDCELIDGWISAGCDILANRNDVAILCGRLRERHPEASIYNRLCQLEWDGPCGEIAECGGIFIIRRAAFEQVGGFDETIIAGEDPDLCLRVRAAGWAVVRAPVDMALHDAAMRRFGQWWRRAVRAGHTCAQSTWRHAQLGDLLNARRTFSILLWALLLPALAIVPAVATNGVSLLLLVAYPVQWWRMRRKELAIADASPRSPTDASLQATFTMLAKFAGLLGLSWFVWNRLLGRATRLIEYK